MSKYYTEDELVEYIKRSNLTNVLIEGKDDLLIYNQIEERINEINIKILPCGGRSTLLEIFKRRNEFNDKNVIFIADQDTWVFTGIPDKYSEIIFTTGYSIENDLYDCASSILLNIMSQTEKNNFNLILKNLTPWYASEIIKLLNGGVAEISRHINTVIPHNSLEIPDHFLDCCGFVKPTDEMLQIVTAKNFQKLRGKFIMQAAARQLNGNNRKSKYSYENILEMCFNLVPNSHFDRIISEIIGRAA